MMETHKRLKAKNDYFIPANRLTKLIILVFNTGENDETTSLRLDSSD